MPVQSPRSRPALRRVAAAALVSTTFSALFAATGAASAQTAPAHTAINLGRQSASTPVTGTVWLQLHNKAALDAAVKALYTPGSPTFQKFPDKDAFKQFAPTPAEMAAVKGELAAHHLTVLSTDANNFSVKFSGLTSDFESAFGTAVNQFRLESGATVKSLTGVPALSGRAAGMVHSVTGIASRGMQPAIKFPTDPHTGRQIGKHAMTSLSASQLKTQHNTRTLAAGKPAAASPAGAFYSSQCFYNPTALLLQTPGATLPVAAYEGLVYGAPPTNTADGTLSPCGYSPEDVQSIYGLNTVYAQGYIGTGQTIAIVDAFGSPTIQADLATFNSIYGLPTPTLNIYQTAPFTATNAGWAGETTLDVEWSHAIAPGANIALVTTPSNMDDDLQGGVLYVIANHLANVVSNSYSDYETDYLSSSDQAGIATWDEICEIAAYEGISVNFATGDNGDLLDAVGVKDVPVPADSPYATGVGGTSVGNNPITGGVVQTGWGNNYAELSNTRGPLDPPHSFGFYAGAGGGPSAVFPLPAYQSSIKATGRQIPDVSAIADPFTGVEIILTEAGEQFVEVSGGTSLATPVFSAEWALLDQRFGTPLGQAAPYIAQFAGTPAITDIVPPPTILNGQGAILDSKGLTTYSPSALGTPQNSNPFLGTLWNIDVGFEYYLTFGTDSSLPVTAGYDNVTGWGSLNMPTIFTALASAQ